MPRDRAWILIGAAAATALVIGYSIYVSLDPDMYFHYGPEHRARWEYDAGEVALVTGVMLVAALIATAALISPRPRWLWVRCCVALLLLIPWGLYAIQVAMHMPVYVLYHHVWVWLLIVVLTLTALVSGARQIWISIRRT